MFQIPRCRVIPLPDHQVAFEVDRRERLRWHFGPQYPRPFFFPLLGPSGATLTRMGHPGAQNHDHHRSIWFAHNKVLGIDFWSENTPARIVQQMWLVYDDDDEARMACRLAWLDGHDPRPLLEQDVIASVIPFARDEVLVEIQTSFTPTAERLEFGQTNFGFLAVRVANSIAVHFGGGELTSSEGLRSEPDLFGRPARWMDYSGPVLSTQGEQLVEGITYFDHPRNPGHPVSWHVRADGWMGSSPCMHAPIEITRERPLSLSYLLHAHGGEVDADRALQVARLFADRPALEIVRASQPHRQFEIRVRP